LQQTLPPIQSSSVPSSTPLKRRTLGPILPVLWLASCCLELVLLVGVVLPWVLAVLASKRVAWPEQVPPASE
jgi:hypothetical protein